jgi:hypothetical protein
MHSGAAAGSRLAGQVMNHYRTFAVHGYNAVYPSLYWRGAPGATPDDAVTTARAALSGPARRTRDGDLTGHARGLLMGMYRRWRR